ncbi:MAG: heme exporter protein CcmB [Leptospiraceae bacterium]|nr:heme exporter protein CcmB [Leptospiraceae bacterium]
MSIKYLWICLKWEFKIQFRSLQIIFMLLFFSLSLTVIYYYSLRSNVFLDEKNYYGLFLLSIFFMVILLSGRGLQREKEAGFYKIILMSPLPRWIFYLNRIFVKSIIIMFIILIFQFIYKILLIGQIYFFKNDLYIVLFFYPCIVNLLAIGEIVSLLSSGNRMRELILPTLFFPLAIPIFIVYATIINELVQIEMKLNFLLTRNFILPIILSIIYVLVGVLFFNYLSVDES